MEKFIANGGTGIRLLTETLEDQAKCPGGSCVSPKTWGQVECQVDKVG